VCVCVRVCVSYEHLGAVLRLDVLIEVEPRLEGLFRSGVSDLPVVQMSLLF